MFFFFNLHVNKCRSQHFTPIALQLVAAMNFDVPS